ncbi:MAG TPA: protein translocase subunit SecD [Abditibacteriaceae bacterium]|jgi:protein-export membrane protein SecD
MFRSRPVQYLGLLLLVLACLAVIFFPIGPAPQAQDYQIRLASSQPFETLAKAAIAKDKKLTGKTATQLANDAIDKAFPSPARTTKGQFELGTGGTSATILDSATTRSEADKRAKTVVTALSKVFPGVALEKATTTDIAELPADPTLRLGQTAVFPMQRDTAIKLGLDLQGGVNLVLQVRRALFTYTFDKKLVTQDERDTFAATVRDALAKAPAAAGLGAADVNVSPDSNQVEIRTQAKDEAEFNAQKASIDAALKGVAGTKLTLARDPQFFQPKLQAGEDPNAFEQQRLKRTVEIVRSRVDTLGVSEPLIQQQGNSRIVVQLPGISDPEKAVQTIGTTARMEIYLTPETFQPDYTDPGNVRFRDRTSGQLLAASEVKKRSELVVEGDQVKPVTSAGYAGDVGSEAAVFFELNSAGANKFADVTRRVAGKGRLIPIFLDERCISAPTVQSAITGGKGQISGGFKDLQEARELALLLNSGALPAPIDVIENRTISATLGADSLRKSLYAGLIGLGLVAIYMVTFYRLAGLLANFALIVYCLMNLAAFILIGGTLTLPGIAGFLLAIAMSLDTNILVFERLREEMAIQPTFAAALRAAFSRAWTAILDSHVTTLIAAVVLFNFGTGPIKGFALTLGIGVLLSLFSAISVTRLFMWSVVHVGEKNQSAFGSAAAITNTTVNATAK